MICHAQPNMTCLVHPKIAHRITDSPKGGWKMKPSAISMVKHGTYYMTSVGYLSIYIYIYTCIHMYINVHTYIYIYTYTYIRMYVKHTYTFILYTFIFESVCEPYKIGHDLCSSCVALCVASVDRRNQKRLRCRRDTRGINQPRDAPWMVYLPTKLGDFGSKC